MALSTAAGVKRKMDEENKGWKKVRYIAPYVSAIVRYSHVV